MIRAAPGGNKPLQRLYSNLHMQPSPECGAAKQISQRCARSRCLWPVPWQGSVAGAAVVVYQDVSCELLVVSEGRLASGWGGGQLTQGLFVKQTEAGLFCPLFDPATRDPSHPATSLPLTLFYRNFSPEMGGSLTLL